MVGYGFSDKPDYKDYLETKNKEDPNFIKGEILNNFSVGDLYDYLSSYDDDIKPAVEKLKSLGIEGERHGYKTDHIFDDKYIKSIDREAYFEEEHLLDHYENEELATAQKIGYVQGVCESVLAFNTDENRKIMYEATMTFLSKKLLSEMNVTKDMAQKFANPETCKALEKCVLAPKQDQQLEQQQSRGRRK